MDATKLRASKQRQERLERYVHGHLPANLSHNIAVVLTKQLGTGSPAGVFEVDIEQLTETLEASPRAVRQMIPDGDPDYVMLITTAQLVDADAVEGTLTQKQLDRQLQYALALHETLHILKTANAAVTDYVQDMPEEQRELFHDLWNTVEDGTMEREVREDPEWSDKAANRIALARQSLGPKITDYSPDQPATLSLFDAVSRTIYDEVVWDTGISAALRDPNDDRVTFADATQRQYFAALENDLYDMIVDVIGIKSSTDELFGNDPTRSLARARRVREFWDYYLAPLYEAAHDDGQAGSQGGEQADSQAQQGGGSQQHGQGGECSPDTADGEAESQAHEGESTPSQSGPTSPTDVDDNHSEATEAHDAASQDQSSADTSSSLDENAFEATTQPVTQPVADKPSLGPSPDQPPEADTSSDDTQSGTHSESQPQQSSQPTSQEHTDVDGNDQSGGQSDDPATHPEDTTGDQQSGKSQGNENAQSAAGGDTERKDEAGESDESETGSRSGDAAEGNSTTLDDDLVDDETKQQAQALAQSDATGNDETDTGDTQLTFGDFGDTGEESRSEQQQDGTDETNGEESADKDGSAKPTAGDQAGNDESPTPNQRSDDSPQASEHSDASGDNQGGAAGAEGRQSPSPGSDTAPEQSSAEAANSQSASERGADQSPTSVGSATDGDAGSEQEGAESPEPITPAPDATPMEPGEPAEPETESFSPTDFPGEQGQIHREQRNETTKHGDGVPEPLQEVLDNHDLEAGKLNEMFDDNAGGGSGAGEDTLDDLTLLSPRAYNGDSHRWDAGQMEQAQQTIRPRLEKALELSELDREIRNRSSGSYQQRTGYRLSMGDPRTFSRQLPGEDKRYHLILVLDRSHSMNRPHGNDAPSKIDVATAATARLVAVAESLDLDVTVIDFYDGDARLVKTPDIPLKVANGPLLNAQAGGGTPLSDALSLAQSTADRSRETPFIISMTDDVPSSVSDTKQEIKEARMPICSITLAMDRDEGNPPEQATELEDAYYQTATVYDEAGLDDSLAQFCSLLRGI